MNGNGNDIYEPSEEDREALARKFHPNFTWSMLRDDEQKGLLDDWRYAQYMKTPPRQTRVPNAVPRAASEVDLIRLIETVQKLVQLQPLTAKAATKASAHLVIRTVGRVLRPVIQQEQKHRAEMQRNLLAMQREWAEQSRRHNDLFSGLLKEICLHKGDEADERARRLDDLEGRVDAATAELARR